MFRLSTRHSPRTASFTLVEMLVIISIVSLLSSISYTGLQEARAMARDARRMTLLHDLRLSLEQYYDEYGFYPVNMGTLYGSYVNASYYLVDNPNDFPFDEAGIDLYAYDGIDIGDSQIPVHPNGARFMEPLIQAGLWNQSLPNDSFTAKGGNDENWPWRQPDGTFKRPTSTDLCGGFIKYRNNAAFADTWVNQDGFGPQTYELYIAFERKKSFDAFWLNDKSGMQFDGGGGSNPGTVVDYNEFTRTALQTDCPWGSSMFVYIQHCAGTWKQRLPPNDTANSDPSIPMHDCFVPNKNGETTRVEWEYEY